MEGSSENPLCDAFMAGGLERLGELEETDWTEVGADAAVFFSSVGLMAVALNGERCLMVLKALPRKRLVKLFETLWNVSSASSRVRWRIDSPPGVVIQGDSVLKAEAGVVSWMTSSSLETALEIAVGGGSGWRTLGRLDGKTKSGMVSDSSLVSGMVWLDTIPIDS